MASLLDLSEQVRQDILAPLIEHLECERPGGPVEWQGWHLTPIGGGRNNLLYRATSSLGDLVLKFTVPDERDRAGREYGSLSALHQAGLSIAPEPILLARSRYAQPVVVLSWLAGKPRLIPPDTDAEWRQLLQHLALVHKITPGETPLRLPWATINANTVEEGRERVREQLAHLPAGAEPGRLRGLIHRLEVAHWPQWSTAPVRLCRLDNNITNYLERPGPWASVDWEYSGWGDPAFDVANLMTHVAYVEVPAWRWAWLVDTYCALVDDATASLRIQAYCKVLTVWWVARLARYLYEIPRGLDRRLVAWSPGWQADLEAKYQRALDRAEELLA